MSFENDKHPKPDRRDEIAVWEARSERSVGLSDRLEERARQIAQLGIPALDAAHLASAKEGEADIVLTCDDILLRRSPRLELALRVVNPVAYFKEVTRDG
jgi:predicted nucleic acid-binding protein